MQQVALAQWAHDIRNALGTRGALRGDTGGAQPTRRTTTSLPAPTRSWRRRRAMCNDAVKQAGKGARRRRARASTSPARFDRSAISSRRHCRLRRRCRSLSRVRSTCWPTSRTYSGVLFNLVHNAATIARRSGAVRRIRLAVACTSTTAIITVADDGPGLPEAIRGRLRCSSKEMITAHKGEAATRSLKLSSEKCREQIDRPSSNCKRQTTRRRAAQKFIRCWRRLRTRRNDNTCGHRAAGAPQLLAARRSIPRNH